MKVREDPPQEAGGCVPFTSRFLTTSCSTSSGTFRLLRHRLKADEWLKMTGALDSCKAAFMVATDTWDKSIMTPRRFISVSTRWGQGIGLGTRHRHSEFEA